MSEVNELIASKLRQQSPEVAELAIDIIRQATRLSRSDLEEYVQEKIRSETRERAGRK